MTSSDNVVNSVQPRVGHTAVAADNFMIIWGGYREDVSSYSESYLPAKKIMVYHTDLDIGYWTQHETEGKVPPGTSGASALLIGHKMYVIGGHTREGNTSALYCLDLKKLKWELICPDSEQTLSPRDKFAAWSYKNRIYCFGGFGVNVKSGKYLNENGKFVVDTSSNLGVEREWNNQLVIYDIESNTWSNPRCQGPVPSPRAAHAAARLNNIVYMFGGRHGDTRMNDLHCLELDTLTWSGELYVEGACPCGRSWHTFTAVSDNTLVLYGGYSNTGQPLDDVWQLNVTKRRWSQITMTTSSPRLWHTTCYSPEGDLLVFGGCENDILNWEESAKQPNKMLAIQLQPYRLQRLCLHKVYNYFTPEKWTVLPKPLLDWLRKKDKLCSLQNSTEKVEEHTVRVGSTCAVS